MRKILFSLSLLLGSTYALAVDTSIKGTWLTTKGDGRDVHITIDDCAEDANKLCGKITWLQQPVYPQGDAEAGQEKHDRKNPDDALKTRKLKGLQLLSNFEKVSDTEFENGTIYNPDDGENYSCTLTLTKDDSGSETLKVYGYVRILIPIGKTQYWKRVSGAQSADTQTAESSNESQE